MWYTIGLFFLLVPTQDEEIFMPLNPAMLSRLSRNDPTLTTLDLAGQKLKASDIEELATRLTHNRYVVTLDLSGNPVGDEGARLLLVCEALRTLKLESAEVTAQGAMSLAQHPGLSALYLSENPIGSAGFNALIQNTRLNLLAVVDCQIKSKDMEPLSGRAALTSLNLSCNQIDDDSCILLAQHEKLTLLNLINNQITDKGIMALASLGALLSLDLTHNNVGVEGAKVLANMRLNRLNLNYNKVGEEGAAFIAGNNTITWLGLAGNGINNPGMTHLANNQTLRYLDVSYNHISDSGAESLINNQSLQKLNINYNEISKKGTAAIAAHPCLVKLSMAHNLLGDPGATVIAKSTTITWLDVAGNQIGWVGGKALSGNQHLKTLLLSYNPLHDIGTIFLSQNKTLEVLSLSYAKIRDAGAIALAENQTLKRLMMNYNYIGKEAQLALKQNAHFEYLSLSEEQPPEFSDDNLDTIFLLSQNFLCIRSREGRIEFFNPAFSRVLGYTDDDLLANNYLDLLHPDDQKQERDIIIPQLQKIPIVKHINRYRCRDGTYRLVEWSTQAKHERIYAMGVDITAQKQVENKLIKSEQAAAKIHLQQAQHYSQKQSDFIANLCHELRNPLGGIQGSLDIIEQHLKTITQLVNEQQSSLPSPVMEKYQHEYEKISESIQDMRICTEHEVMILNDNLDITKLEEGKFQLANQAFELKNAIQEASRILKSKAENKGLALTLSLPENALWVKGDVIRIKQIIINLFSNAIKFTEQGAIDIALSVHERTAIHTRFEIRVTDTGIGMTEQEIGKLFERFVQASSTNQYGGSGLGLLITKNLALLMKGDISVESEQGRGTIFRCILQCNTSAHLEQQSPLEKITPALPTASATLLVVDDNAINRKILGFTLQQAGYTCLFATNGQEAIAQYQQHQPAAILMDIIMPEVDGLEATQEIRRLEGDVSHVPIIALTGNALEQHRKQAMDAGMDDYLTKPFKKEIVLQKIANLLAMSQNSPSSKPVSPASLLQVALRQPSSLWYQPQTETPSSPIQGLSVQYN
jgi:PAS domain S-box-containing protein